MLYALCSMLYALCSMLYALCSLSKALCSIALGIKADHRRDLSLTFAPSLEAKSLECRALLRVREGLVGRESLELIKGADLHR